MAYVNDLIVVTANVKDFEGFKDVAVERPADGVR
jgi:predicted nucleic acid-binding protein